MYNVATIDTRGNALRERTILTRGIMYLTLEGGPEWAWATYRLDDQSFVASGYEWSKGEAITAANRSLLDLPICLWCGHTP
jgi:hypothetical protein